MSPDDIEAIAQRVAQRLAADHDPTTLMSAERVAALLDVEPRYVTEEFARAPGFPEALRLTGPGRRRGHPRWVRSEILAWIQSHRRGASKRGGRPRKTPE